MGYESNTIVGITFIILFAGLISSIPSDFYVPSSVPNFNIPSQFDSLNRIVGNGVDINMNISKGFIYTFLFKDINPLYFNHELRWAPLVNPNEIRLYRKDSWFDISPSDYVPVLDRNYLKTQYSSETNTTVVKFSDGKGIIYGTFAGMPKTSQNITQAWDAGLINCTLTIIPDQSGIEKIDGYQLVQALIRFRIPDIYEDINPLLGFVLSLFFYVPVIMIVFTTGVKVLHG